jgi:hypothetical protein
MTLSSLLPPASQTNTVALRLLEHTHLPLDAPILDLGAGNASLLDALLEQGYTNMIAADVSAAALDAHQQILTTEQVQQVLWLVDDVTHPQELRTLSPILLWHDRAMLPLLRLAQQQAAYREILDYMVLPGEGWVLLSAYEPEAAPTGDMPVQTYSLTQLVAFLGPDYTLHGHQAYMQLQPDSTSQPCRYVLFKRQEQTEKPFRRPA